MATDIFKPIKLGKETFHPQSFNENSFVMNYKLEAGGKVPPHLHIYMDEYFSVTKGEMKFNVNGKIIMRKAGEEIMVPKGTKHSIANKGKEQVEMTVKYMPCADTHRLFQIIAALSESKPVTIKTMMKALYIMKKLKLKTFSTPQPAIANSIIVFILTIMGYLSGWNKLTSKFK